MFEADIYELQEDAKNLIKRISDLMKQSGKELPSEDDFEKECEEYQKKLNIEIDKINNLELRMAIAAPMKAGKSTIINAIIGRELLPHRERAMTILPTEVVFAPNLTEPILTINDNTIKIFKELWQEIHNKLSKEKGFAEVKAATKSYSQLESLIDEIKVSKNFPINQETCGDERIRQSLEKLNDLVRLYYINRPNYDPLQDLSDVPRITTPLVKLRDVKGKEMLGNLVIVDTPGPNEVGEMKLTDVIQEQLKKSSLVLLVLDYTRLDDKTSDEIRQVVQRIIKGIDNNRINTISKNVQINTKNKKKENLYILVNRIDQRRTSNSSDTETDKENVKQFVSSRYGIPVDDNSYRLFEISAVKAFKATQLLLEIQEDDKKEISELKSLDMFLKEGCADSWQIMKEHFQNKNNISYLYDFACSTVWKNSGFVPFLENAISILMLQAAPLCIENALLTTEKTLQSWQQPVVLRKAAISAGNDEINQAITKLQNYLNKIESFVQNEQIQTEINQNKKQLKEQLKTDITTAKNNAKKVLLEESRITSKISLGWSKDLGN